MLKCVHRPTRLLIEVHLKQNVTYKLHIPIERNIPTIFRLTQISNGIK